MKFVRLNKNYSYNDMVNDTSMLSIAYPDFIHTEIIGTSVSNRSIILFRLGKGEKGIILTGGVHGRESINPIVMMAMMEEYATMYYDRSKALEMKEREQIDVAEFFEEYSIYMVPLVNPDGYMIAQRGFHMIHNEELREEAIAKNVPFEQWKYNSRGIDINRNFPSRNWVKKFEEDEAASEAETRALIRLFHEVDSCAYIDYHSRGNEIFYYRKQLGEEYNRRQLMIAKRLAKMTGYSLIEPEEEIGAADTGGNTVHYYSECFEQPAITIETVPEEEEFPLYIGYQEITYQQILYTPFYVI